VSEEQPTRQIAIGSYIAQALGQGAKAIINIFRGSTAEQRALRNRQAMLQLVRNTWIKDVLEQSLHGAAMIELGLEERADAVERPWDIVLQTPDRPNRQLPPGTKIMDVFDEMNRALLILGEPGSGKTTMLLELARDMIARAEEDPMQPIPVVFNLSSWAEKRQPIVEWLVDELTTKYNIPKKIARPWVENGDLLLLLDGLDEVKLERREACVKAINDFRQEHGLTPLVVCSRIADYEALTTRLKLRGAVLLQPLTSQQVDQYLAGTGAELAVVRETLEHDATFQELAQTPLMLSVMTLAYRGVSAKDLQSLDTTEARRRYVFDAYVQRMFERRGIDECYSPEQTIYWLAWLARKMSQHAQTVFLIERMQPSWLPTRIWRWVYVLGSRLIGMLILGLSVAPIVGRSIGRGITLFFEQYFEMMFGQSLEMMFGQDAEMIFGLTGGLSFGLSLGLIGGFSIGFIDALRFERDDKNAILKKTPTRWQSAINFLAVGLILWLGAGLSLGLSLGLDLGLIWGRISGWTSGLQNGLITVLFGGLIGGLFFGPLSGLMGGLIFGLRGSRQSLTNDIQAVEPLRWSWGRALKGGVLGLIVGLVFGLGVVLVALLVEVLVVRPIAGLPVIGPFYRSIDMVIDGLIFGPIFGLIGAVFGGLSSGVVETRIAPNQGIRFSVRNAVFAGLTFGMVLGLICGLSYGPGYGVGYGLISGLLAGLWYGGLDIIQHFTLRFILYRNGHIPWNYTCLLDYAAERIFLRKVGGGYIFVHRLLMDYFASLEGDGG